MPVHDDIRLFFKQLRTKDVRQQNSPTPDVGANNFITIRIIVVAPNKRDRRDRAQRLEHMLAADIAGVKNCIDTFERRKSLWANQTMSVRDDADFGTAIPRSMLSSPRSNPGIGP